MKILKKNQIIISVLAVALITVGYMNYGTNMANSIQTSSVMDSESVAGIGDAKFVNSNSVVGNAENGQETEEERAETATHQKEELAEQEENEQKVEKTNNVETNEHTNNEDNSNSQIEKNNLQDNVSTETGSKNIADYFTTSRLEREKMYSQMLETYQKLLENEAISPEQKNIASQEVAKINNTKKAIMISENLIKNLGFEDIVIFVNDKSTSVVVKAENLEEADIAKIQNIVCRELGVEAEFIHISLKK